MNASNKKLGEQLQRVVSDLLAVELADLPGLSRLGDTFADLGDVFGSAYPRSVAACRACTKVLEAIILEEQDDPEAALRRLEDTAAALQTVHDNNSEEGVAFAVLRDSESDPAAGASLNEEIDALVELGADGGADPADSGTPDEDGAHEQGGDSGTTAAATGAEPGRRSESAPAADAVAEGAPTVDAAAAMSTAPDPEFQALLEPVTVADPNLTVEFIGEAREHFEIADEQLVALENDAGDKNAVAAVFRAFHTVKGTSGFLELTPITRVAHLAESLLDAIRNDEMVFENDVADAMFSALDVLKVLVDNLAGACAEGGVLQAPANVIPVARRLQAVLTGEGGHRVQEAAVPAEAGIAPRGVASGDGAADSSRSAARSVMKERMKIDVDKIDTLLDTIGELVIIESIVNEDEVLREVHSPGLKRNLSQLTKITRSLQDMGMSMRMVPIGPTFHKMSRLVRDLSRKAGKDIELEISGEDTEIDKGMVEGLNDPLVHMVRNAVDHGIEATVKARQEAGKPLRGKVSLRAFHEGGNIHIQIQDDGRGLDRDAIARRAIERGIVAETDSMTDNEIFSLVFEPGFSTAEKITDISGRGVGMDVVKSNIQSMRGSVRIESEAGRGSTFTLVLPLTMAIINGMHCQVGHEKYIIPILSIIQSFQPHQDQVFTVSGKGEMVRFREGLLPLFRLSRLFHCEGAEEEPTQGILVVVEDAGRRAALLVDELLGQRQTVIKSLGEGLGDVSGLAGATILSDGTPGLIADVHGIVSMATGKGQEEGGGEPSRQTQKRSKEQELEPLPV